MGSLREWLMVTFYCMFWGGWMLAWETRKRKAASVKPAFLPASVFIWILSGLTLGLLMTFKWQALRSPLLFITVGSLMCGLVITRLTRHERSKAFKQRVTWMKTMSFFVLMGGLALLLVSQAIIHTIGYFCLVAAGLLLALDYFQSRRQELRPISKRKYARQPTRGG
jgi:NhaP-type Na+/H+ or K+/H+ antiporter